MMHQANVTACDLRAWAGPRLGVLVLALTLGPSCVSDDREGTAFSAEGAADEAAAGTDQSSSDIGSGDVAPDASSDVTAADTASGTPAPPDLPGWQVEECESYCQRLVACLGAMCPASAIGSQTTYLDRCKEACFGSIYEQANASALHDAECPAINAQTCSDVEAIADVCDCPGDGEPGCDPATVAAGLEGVHWIHLATEAQLVLGESHVMARSGPEGSDELCDTGTWNLGCDSSIHGGLTLNGCFGEARAVYWVDGNRLLLEYGDSSEQAHTRPPAGWYARGDEVTATSMAAMCPAGLCL